MGDHLISACTDTQFALCTKCTLHSNHRLTRVIFPHTRRLLPPPERPFSHYIHSHRLAAEMWTTMKNKLRGKKLSCTFYLYFYMYRFRKYASYRFPIINFCNPGVHYETPCIVLVLRATTRCIFWSSTLLGMFVQADLKDLVTLRTRTSSDSVRSASTRTTVSQFQRCGSGNNPKLLLCQNEVVDKQHLSCSFCYLVWQC
jgi:hypothetical protein